MAEIKCLQRIVKAIDSMHPLLKTDEEFEKFIAHWREKERGRHRSDASRDLAVAAITRTEIESIIKQRKFRLNADTEVKTTRKQRAKRFPVGMVTAHTVAINILANTFEAWRFDRFASCDIYTPANKEYLRLVFHGDDSGYFKLGFHVHARPYNVRCISAIRDLGMQKGQYELIPLNEEKTEFGIDVSNGPVEAERSRTGITTND